MKVLPILIGVASLLSCHAQEPKPFAGKTELGKPVVIDGIEVTFSQATIGKLPAAKQDGFLTYSVPVGDYFIVPVTLKNVTDNKIVTLQSVWSNTRLLDEHGNFYRAMDPGEGVSGGIAGKLKPGADAKGIIVFEVPLPVAKSITLICDPGFYRDNGDGTINDLSKGTARCEMKNPAAKPSPPVVAPAP